MRVGIGNANPVKKPKVFELDPGAEAFGDPGAEAFGDPGAEAFGDPGVEAFGDPERKQPEIPEPSRIFIS